jgi:hypothetical protein
VAADEGHPRAALVALEAGDHDDADLGGRAGVRPAAGLAVEALGLHDPDPGLDALGGLQALGPRLGRGEEADPDRARFPGDLVRPALGRARLLLQTSLSRSPGARRRGPGRRSRVVRGRWS